MVGMIYFITNTYNDAIYLVLIDGNIVIKHYKFGQGKINKLEFGEKKRRVKFLKVGKDVSKDKKNMWIPKV